MQPSLAETAVQVIADFDKFDDDFTRQLDAVVTKAAKRASGSLDRILGGAGKAAADLVGKAQSGAADKMARAYEAAGERMSRSQTSTATAAERAAERAAAAQERASERASAAAARAAEKTGREQSRQIAAATRAAEREAAAATRVAEREAAKGAAAQERATTKAANAAERSARQAANAQIREANRAAREVAAAAAKAARAQEQEAKRAALAVQRQSEKTRQSMRDAVGSGVSGVGSGFSAIGTAATVAGAAAIATLAAIGKQGLQSAGELEQVRVGFTNLLGSSTQANDLLAQVQQMAANTPFEFQGLVTTTQQMLGMSEAAGIAKDQILPTVGVIGDLAAALGQGQPAIDSTVRALGQMASAGKVNAQDLLQITSAMPGFDAWGAMASQLGLTTAQLRKMSEDGTLPAKDAIAGLIQGMANFKGAAGAMQAQSETLLGVFSTFKDNAKLALVEGFAPALPGIKQSLKDITPIIAEASKTIAPALGHLMETGMKLLGPVIGGLADIAKPVLDALSQAMVVLEPAIGPVSDALVAMATALAPTIPLLAQIVATVAQPLALALQALSGFLSPIISALAGPLTEALAQLTPLFADMAVQFQPLFVAMGNITAQLLAPLAQYLPGIVTAFVDQLAPHLPEIVDAFVGFLPVLQQVVDNLSGGLGELLAAQADKMPGYANAVIQVALAFGEVMTAVGPLLVTISDWMATGLANIDTLDNVVASLQTLAWFLDLTAKNTQIVTELLRGYVSGVLALADAAVSTWNTAKQLNPTTALLPDAKKWTGEGRDMAQRFIDGMDFNTKGAHDAGEKLFNQFAGGVGSGLGKLGASVGGAFGMGTALTTNTKNIPTAKKIDPNDTEAARKKAAALAAKIAREAEQHRVAMENAGAFLGEGLVEGLTGALGGIQGAADKMIGLLNKALGTKAAAVTVALIRKDTISLRAEAKTRDHIADLLKAAQDKLSKVLDDAAQMRQGIADKARAAFVLVPDRGVKSVQRLLTEMRKAVDTTTEFTKNIAKLKARGLSDALVKQLADAGPIAGAAQAAALARASASQIRTLSAMSGRLEGAATGAGKLVSDLLYASGIAAAQGLVAGLKSQQSAIENQMMAIAKAMQTAIKRALGIKSPSTVMQGVADQTMDGLEGRIRARIPNLARTMHRVGGVVGAGLAVPVIPGQRQAGQLGGPSGMAGRGGALIDTMNINLPTGDPMAAAQTVVNRIAAKVG